MTLLTGSQVGSAHELHMQVIVVSKNSQVYRNIKYTYSTYIYSCFEKLTTEKCKHKASRPEKELLEIKDFMKDLKLNPDKGTTFIKNIFLI